MGSFQAKQKSTSNNYLTQRDVEALRQKVKLQKEEIKELMSMRESEVHAYEQEIMAFVLKEEEWKRERKQLREEQKEFRKKLEEREANIRGLIEDEEMVGDKTKNDWKMWGNSYLMECMREERSRRDEAVDKWKRLYLAIKTELDHLLNMRQQESEEANQMDELHIELQAKEETIELLEKQLALKEKEKWRMEREIDILKQSLRIITHRKGKKNAKCLQKSLPKQK